LTDSMSGVFNLNKAVCFLFLSKWFYFICSLKYDSRFVVNRQLKK
jgi:hypothetical protein